MNLLLKVVLCSYLPHPFLPCSSGDNVLNLLLDRPKKICESVCLDLINLKISSSCITACYLCTVAIDMSPAQNAMLEIKLAAIRHLEYHDYLCLLGEKAEDQDSISRYM